MGSRRSFATGFAPPSTLVECGLAEEVVERIDFPDLAADIDTDMWTVLDVRGAAEFGGAHIPGAINIAYTRLASRIDEVPRDKPIMAYCRTGNRASAAAALLAREGFDVTLVDGAFAYWAGLNEALEPAGVA